MPTDWILPCYLGAYILLKNVRYTRHSIFSKIVSIYESQSSEKLCFVLSLTLTQKVTWLTEEW